MPYTWYCNFYFSSLKCQTILVGAIPKTTYFGFFYAQNPIYFDIRAVSFRKGKTPLTYPLGCLARNWSSPYFFCPVTKQTPNNMLHKSKLALSDSERIDQAIKEFFSNCGDSKNVESILWDMLFGSLTNPESSTEPHQNDQRMFLYKRLSEFLESIEPRKNNITFNNN